MNDGLGVARGSKHVPAPGELSSELGIVVDLAVEDDPHRAVFVRDGLVSVREVDDAQPAHAERDAPAEMNALVVRPTMRHPAAHRADLTLGDRTATRAQDSRDSAHNVDWSRCSVRL